MVDKFSPLDINNADRDALLDLPGVGSALADRIIQARPFESLEDMQRVEGIGPALLERFEPLLRFSEPQKEVFSTSDELDVDQSFDDDDQNVLEILELESTLDEPGMSDGEAEEHTEEPLFEDALAAADSVSIVAEKQLESDRLGDEDLEVKAGAIEIEESQIEDEIADELIQDDLHPEDEDRHPEEDEPIGDEAAAIVTSQPKVISRGEVYMSAAGCSVIALVLAIVLTLGILTSINGGLTYIRPATTLRLSGELDRVNDQIDSLEQDIEEIQIYLERVEDTSDRVDNLEGEFEQLNSDLTALTTDIDELSGQMGAVEDELTILQANSAVFREFLDGFRELVDGLEFP